MPIITNIHQTIKLIEDEDFFQALMIDSTDEYDQKTSRFHARFSEFYASSFVEKADGITIFQTPKRPINGCGNPWGTWLTVAKQYGNTDAPYLVSAHEYAPWGVEDDIGLVAQYKDLGQALDHALAIDDVVRGVSSHMEGSFDANVLSQGALLINEAVKTLPRRRDTILAKEKAEMRLREQAHKLAWESPIPLEEARPIIEDVALRISRADIGHYSDNMLAAAAAIQKQVFVGQDKLLTYRCVDVDDMECMGFSKIGTTFVVLERGPGEFTFVSPDCGIHDTAEAARSAVTEKLVGQYASMMEGENLYWNEAGGELVELHLDELLVDESQPSELDPDIVQHVLEYDDYSFAPDGYEMISVVRHACSEYRHLLQRKIELELTGSEHSLPEIPF